MIEKTRKFGGKLVLEKCKTDRERYERNFEKKHLKAYLRGWQYFPFGRNPDTNQPMFYETKEIWE